MGINLPFGVRATIFALSIAVALYGRHRARAVTVLPAGAITALDALSNLMNELQNLNKPGPL